MQTGNERRVVVGTVEEISPGGRKIIVPFRGRAGIGVFNVNGTFHALRNLCPHKSGPLCTGRVSGRIVAVAPPSVDDPGLTVERDGEIIRCPWHLWEFDIATGRCLVDPRARVKTYPVVVEGDQVVVYADPAGLPVQTAAADQ
jgi:nitrite reductase/ring-hydroxylating ferredoxin subunit